MSGGSGRIAGTTGGRMRCHTYVLESNTCSMQPAEMRRRDPALVARVWSAAAAVLLLVVLVLVVLVLVALVALVVRLALLVLVALVALAAVMRGRLMGASAMLIV